MINITPNLQPKTVGLYEEESIGWFEINDAGTVLYCRTAAEKLFSEKTSAAVGRNFFDEVAPFENMEELRRRFRNFIQSGSTTVRFTFSCQLENQKIPAKVLLVRIVERSNSERSKATIVDIRKI